MKQKKEKMVTFRVRPLFKGVELPGFVRDEGRGWAQAERVEHYDRRNYGPEPYYFRWTSPTIVLVAMVRKLTLTVRADGYDTLADGHTHYKYDDKAWWACFDRTGIDDSFYLSFQDGKVDDVRTTLMKEIERVHSHLAAVKAAGPSEAVPGTQWSVTAARKAEIITKLKNGKCHHFTPYGMGQGLLISVRRNSRWDHSLPKAAEFFGVPTLYGSSTDCD